MSVFAEDDSMGASDRENEELPLPDMPIEELRFFAVNAGYKDNMVVSTQNYDFFVLEKTDDEPLSLGGYQIIYTNSSGNAVGELNFDVRQELQAQYLVMGYSKSPQYQDKSEDYLYSFGTAGLASTGGKLSLYKDDELIDDICWGKLECTNQIPKFNTTEQDNLSVVLHEGEFIQEEYYPEIDETAIV
jgi:hypothetical protein